MAASIPFHIRARRSSRSSPQYSSEYMASRIRLQLQSSEICRNRDGSTYSGNQVSPWVLTPLS